MRRLMCLAALLLAGCSGVEGPIEHYRNFQRPDVPGLPIYDQEKLGRQEMSMPEFHKSVAPPTGIDFPGPHGR